MGLFSKTLEDIVAPLKKIEKQLEYFVSNHLNEIEQHQSFIDLHNEMIEDKQKAVDSAKKVSKNISNLLS